MLTNSTSKWNLIVVPKPPYTSEVTRILRSPNGDMTASAARGDDMMNFCQGVMCRAAFLNASRMSVMSASVRHEAIVNSAERSARLDRLQARTDEPQYAVALLPWDSGDFQTAKTLPVWCM